MKIFAIQGYSSSGKDSIVNRISTSLSIPTLISHTTRPMRNNEVEGKAYYFVNDNFFKENKDDFLEKREYKTVDGIWKYGLHRDELKDKPYTLFIVDRQGYEELYRKVGDDKIISIFIEVEENELSRRQKLRGDSIDEFERRIKDDIEKFKGYIADYIVYNENLDIAVEKVKDIIIEEMGI